MIRTIECAGAPRDLGLDQGRACAGLLRARFAETPWRERAALHLGRLDRRSARVARDLRRYFPHQSESLDGLARGARVPGAWLRRELWSGAASVAGRALAASGARCGGGALLARGPAPRGVLRRSRPEGGFASLELTLPGLTAALAGVNEAGLAAVALGGVCEAGPCAAPALLLTQDCLRRLESVAGALEWCLARPAAGVATLLFGDAAGEVAGVEIAGRAPRVLRPAEAGLLTAGASDAALAKSLEGAGAIDLEGLARALARVGAPDAGPRIGLDPGGRRIALAAGEAPPAWLSL